MSLTRARLDILSFQDSAKHTNQGSSAVEFTGSLKQFFNEVDADLRDARKVKRREMEIDHADNQAQIFAMDNNMSVSVDVADLEACMKSDKSDLDIADIEAALGMDSDEIQSCSD